LGPFLVFLVGFAFDALGCHRPRLETFGGDFVAAFIADAIGSFVDAFDGLPDLGKQFAFSVTDAEFEAPV
jgi:hypothetical protein